MNSLLYVYLAYFENIILVCSLTIKKMIYSTFMKKVEDIGHRM